MNGDFEVVSQTSGRQAGATEGGIKNTVRLETAVARWWARIGCHRYRQAGALLLLADSASQKRQMVVRTVSPVFPGPATMSLARLWQRQGRRAEARGALAGVYGAYTEGFTTPDLVDAKALLETLA